MVRPGYVVKEDVKKNIVSENNEDVIIAGNIYPNIEIKVKGNMIILGSIEGIKIDCGKDLLIAGGINNKCEVRVKNNCIAQFVANSKLSSENSIYVPQYILNSEVKSKEDIVVRKREFGEIVGGEIATENGSIETNTVGSVSGISTNLRVATGIQANKIKSLKNTLNELEKEKLLLEANIKKIEPRITFTYTKIKSNSDEISDFEKVNFKKNLFVYKELKYKLKEKNKEINETTDQAKFGNGAELGKHQIRIFKEVYGGVSIQIRNIKYFFKYNSYRPYLMCKHPVLPKIESLVLKK